MLFIFELNTLRAKIKTRSVIGMEKDIEQMSYEVVIEHKKEQLEIETNPPAGIEDMLYEEWRERQNEPFAD